MGGFDITIEHLPQLPNALLGAHWRIRSRHATLWRKRIREALLPIRSELPKRPLRKANLICIRRSSRCPDYDGLVGSFKAPIDALVKLRVLEDDAPEIIGKPKCLWDQASPRQGSITIRVEW